MMETYVQWRNDGVVSREADTSRRTSLAQTRQRSQKIGKYAKQVKHRENSECEERYERDKHDGRWGSRWSPTNIDKFRSHEKSQMIPREDTSSSLIILFHKPRIIDQSSKTMGFHVRIVFPFSFCSNSFDKNELRLLPVLWEIFLGDFLDSRREIGRVGRVASRTRRVEFREKISVVDFAAKISQRPVSPKARFDKSWVRRKE